MKSNTEFNHYKLKLDSLYLSLFGGKVKGKTTFTAPVTFSSGNPETDLVIKDKTSLESIAGVNPDNLSTDTATPADSDVIVTKKNADGKWYQKTFSKVWDYIKSKADSAYLKLTGGTVTGTLILSRTQDASGTANNKPALIVGGTDTQAHLEMDANEIMAKSNGTTTTVLHLNNDGGLVYANGKKVAKLTSDPTSGQVMVADGTDGNIISSGYTIAKSVPSDANFSNTWTALVGATSSANGTGGYISAAPPKDGYNSKFFRADGTWSAVTKGNVGLGNVTNDAQLPLAGGTMTGRIISAKPNAFLVTGSGTAGAKSSDSTPVYTPATWKFNTGITTLVDGDIITVKMPNAGHEAGVYMSIDNGTTYKPVAISGTTRLTTHYSSGQYLTVQYEASGTVAAYPKAGGTATSTVTGIWRVLNYRDTNTTYSAMSQSEATTGTATTARTITAKVLNDTYVQLTTYNTSSSIQTYKMKLTCMNTSTSGSDATVYMYRLGGSNVCIFFSKPTVTASVSTVTPNFRITYSGFTVSQFMLRPYVNSTVDTHLGYSASLGDFYIILASNPNGSSRTFNVEVFGLCKLS